MSESDVLEQLRQAKERIRVFDANTGEPCQVDFAPRKDVEGLAIHRAMREIEQLRGLIDKHMKTIFGFDKP